MASLSWTQVYKSEINRKQINAHVRLLLPVLLAIELSLRCPMCDLHSKFEEDRTQTAVAIVDDRYLGQIQTHTQTYTRVI